MAEKMTDEKMLQYIEQNRENYLKTFQEDVREEKSKESEGMELKKLYQKMHLRLSNEEKKKKPIYAHLQFINKCGEDDLQMLKNAIEARQKSIKNNRKKILQNQIKKILDNYNKESGDTLTIQYNE